MDKQTNLTCNMRYQVVTTCLLHLGLTDFDTVLTSLTVISSVNLWTNTFITSSISHAATSIKAWTTIGCLDIHYNMKLKFTSFYKCDKRPSQ